jgi:site-specific DNA recombinase
MTLYDYAQQKGYSYEPGDVYTDRGYSGQRLERPGLDALRDAIWQGRYDQLVIFSPDRLARHYVHQYLLLEEFSRHGCEVLFVHHAYGQSPEEQMLLQLQGIFSQYEHAKITERIRRGRLHQLQAGRAHYSTPPYGYVYVPQREGVPGRIEIHPAEADVVRQIFHWLVEEALSSHQLAQRLNALKIATKHDCGYWQQSVVLSLLRNPLYRGTAYFHRYRQWSPPTRSVLAENLAGVHPMDSGYALVKNGCPSRCQPLSVLGSSNKRRNNCSTTASSPNATAGASIF